MVSETETFIADSSRGVDASAVDAATGSAGARRGNARAAWFRGKISGLVDGRNKGSIVDRIFWLLVIWGLFTYALAIAGLWWGSSQIIEDSFESQAAEWVRKLDELGTPLYASGDTRHFEPVREYVARFPDLSYLRYYDVENRRVIAEYYADGFPAFQVPYLSAAEFTNLSKIGEADHSVTFNTFDDGYSPSLMQATAPLLVRSVRSDGFMEFNLDETAAETERYEVIGFIELGLDFGPYRQQLLQNILRGSLLIAAIFLLAAIFGRRIVRKSLRPLTSLHDPLKKLADGDIDVRVPGAGDREIDAIANALNTTIAALKDRDRKLQDLANYDSLTGLLNKQNFHQRLERELKRVAGGRDSSALMFIDLDQFKYVNDSLGHAAGDRLLARVAELLASRTRKSDVLSRFGGDEFTVIVKSVGREQAEDIAASIVKGMQDFVFVEEGKPFNVYCSVGVAMIESCDESVEEIFSHADMACYYAKSLGRNCYHIYDAQTRESRDTGADLSWAKAIGEALKSDAFELRFQPLIGVEDLSCDFYQLQLRMKMSNGDSIDADQFMPAADRMGLSAQIGERQLQDALKKLADATAGGRKIQLLIALPDGYFEVPDLQYRISKALDNNSIPASSLIFELSERTALKRIEQTRQRMQALGELGCRFCLGDLEPRTASLGYLNELAVDYLKIDASLLAAKRGDPVNRILVESMIRVARELGRQTIAGQIRSARMVDVLEDYEVDYLQGPFIGKPVTTLHVKTYQKLVARFCRNAASESRSRGKVIPMTKSQ